MKYISSFIVTLCVLCSTSCWAESITKYVSKDGIFQFELPPEWMQMPQKVLEESIQSMEELGAKSAYRYEAAFQPKSLDWFSGAYIYAWSNHNGRIGELYLKDSTIPSENIASSLQGMAPLLGIKNDGKVVYDSKRQVMLSVMDANPGGVVAMTVLTAQFLTSDGYYTLSFYCPKAEWSKQLEIFDQILLSATVAEAQRFELAAKVYQRGNRWTSQDSLFYIDIPKNWVEIKSQQRGEFEVGFQAYDSPIPLYPYVIVKRIVGDMENSSWEELKQSAESGDFVRDMKSESQDSIEILSVNDSKRLVTLRQIITVPGIGVVSNVMHMFFARNCVLTFHCYQLEELYESTSHVYLELPNHVGLKQSMLLRETTQFSFVRFADDNFKWILGVLGSMVVALWSIYSAQKKES